MTVWVLTKATERQHPESDDNRPYAVYRTRHGIERRIELIAAANPQHEMRKVGENLWRIGPDEDEGFFGDRVIWFHAYEVKADLS